MFLHVPKESTSSGPFSELFLEESTPGSAALQMSAQDRGCAGICFKVCSVDEGLHLDAEDPGAIPSSAAGLQWLLPFKAEV